jgi:hypothetical protein
MLACQQVWAWAWGWTTYAPPARLRRKAVWTGSEMIVWGGSQGYPTYFNTGGRYFGGPYPTPTPTTPPLTIVQPNGGEAWLMVSVHEIKWEGTNLTQSDRLIIQYNRTGGASYN